MLCQKNCANLTQWVGAKTWPLLTHIRLKPQKKEWLSDSRSSYQTRRNRSFKALICQLDTSCHNIKQFSGYPSSHSSVILLFRKKKAHSHSAHNPSNITTHCLSHAQNVSHAHTHAEFILQHTVFCTKYQKRQKSLFYTVAYIVSNSLLGVWALGKAQLKLN